MPAMTYTIRWPDGTLSRCYSPSLIIRDHFHVGHRYSIQEFLNRLRAATAIASDRVQAKYGFPCSRAQAQLTLIEERALQFALAEPGSVEMLAFAGDIAP